MPVTVSGTKVVNVSAEVTVEVEVKGGPQEDALNTSVIVSAFRCSGQQEWQLYIKRIALKAGDQARYEALCKAQGTSHAGWDQYALHQEILRQITGAVFAALQATTTTPAA